MARRSPRKSRSSPPVLLPREDDARAPTPPIVPLLALIGLAILCFWTLPAVAEHQRLQRDYAELQRKARTAQDALEERRRALRAGRAQAFARIKARRELLAQGARYLESRPPPPEPAPAGGAASDDAGR